MSMPHECKCGICGYQIQYQSPLEDRQASELLAKVSQSAGVRALASAILKIAPEAAQEIAKRWQEVQANERVALDEFLTFLHSTETQEAPHE